MGMQLPGELVSVLADLGYTWPAADEEKLLAMGHAWTAFGAELAPPVDEAHAQARTVSSLNEGAAVAAFQQAWDRRDSPAANLDDAATAATMVGAGLMVCAGAVLALKVNVIVQLVALCVEIAQALATAAPTLGASLAEIPLFKTITGTLIDELLDVAIGAILGG